MLELARSIDIETLCEALELSGRAVRSRLTGKRDLTIREIGAIADLVGIDLLFYSLRSSFHDDHGVNSHAL